MIAVKVFCKTYNKNMTVYCYRFSDGEILSNGCDNMCGSAVCKECCRKSVEVARDSLPDALFHQP